MKKIFRKKGFTLVELIVVIAILGILAAIAIPRLSGFSDQAKAAADKDLANTIAHAEALWAANHDGAFTTTLTDLSSADLINAEDIQIKSKLWGGPEKSDKVTIIKATTAKVAVTGNATEPDQPAVAVDQYYVDLNGHVGALLN